MTNWLYGESLSALKPAIELHVTGENIDVCVFHQADSRLPDGTPYRIQWGTRHDGAVVGRENDGPWLALKVVEGLFSKQFIWPQFPPSNPGPGRSDNSKWNPPRGRA